MISNRRSITLFPLAALLSLSVYSHGAPLIFDYVANVDSSDRPGAPTGSILTGRIIYDPVALDRQVGEHDYFPTLGTSSISARGSQGFYLSQDVRVINVTPGPTADNMTIQTFLSESPNDWHMVIDFIEPPGGANGWLQGDSSLPTAFPDVLQYANLAMYFTDEADWVRNVHASLISVTPAVVPLPAAAWLFGSALIALAGFKRRR
ncbi:MAG: VPLPA-CTERM sorting domain-containing protein [Pseudomonadales bacterium]|nr:VPLPA-CTERM sorting domain-containing protein [Halioglobus sp.]MCP5129454.1 VPLPA-CTERM sorting domain-containing protein [Pseudomonadales bacterium]